MEQKELLSRGVLEIIQEDSLEKKLESGKKLRIKHGVDPTTADLHLGYAVVYRKLRAFQDLGHQIIFLIGDFTARFGDPTAQDRTRKMRPKEEVKKLSENYLKQAGKILDLEKTEVRFNGEWYDQMSAEELLKLISNFTNSQLIERDMFQNRLKKSQDVFEHEVIYPILQAYDSVMLESDLTIIGSDQKFNELLARDLQQKMGQNPQDLMIMPLLLGTDGKRKMSQSLGNYIGLSEEPKSIYGKVMSIPDQLILQYFELLTDVEYKSLDIIKKELKEKKRNPRDVKAELAKLIVETYCDASSAEEAEAEFEKVFRKGESPSEMPEVKLERGKEFSLTDLLVETKLAASRSEARRLISQKAVKVDGKVIDDNLYRVKIKNDLILQVGPRRFVKIVT